MVDTDAPTTLNEACDHRVDHYHGTYTSYRVCGCRCGDCREAQTRYMVDWKDRRAYGPRGKPWEPRSAEWLTAMRKGLYQAVAESYERHGKVTA